MNTEYSIVVVEDQPAERNALLRFLQAEGFTAYGAGDGEAALQHVHQRVDLVLSDVRMHPMDGFELLMQWKARRPETPFILMTAFGDIPTAVEAIKNGAKDYLVKPIRPDELVEKIAAALKSGLENEPQVETMPLSELERVSIERALVACRGNRTHAARQLGISVRTLQRKLRAWAQSPAGSPLG